MRTSLIIALLAGCLVIAPAARAGDAPHHDGAAGDVERGMERGGNAVERGVTRAGEATGRGLGTAVDKTGEGIGFVLDKTGQGLEKAGEALEGE